MSLLWMAPMVAAQVYTTIEHKEHFGEVKVVCDLSASNPLMYIELNATLYENSPTTGFDMSLSVPDECAPYQHVYCAFNPNGHPGWDGRGGGYGLPHYDFHFHLISNDERVARLSNCTTVGATAQCDATATDQVTLAFFEYPPRDYTTGFFVDTTFGNHAVLDHGMHLIADGDKNLTTCDGGSNGWVDCNDQMVSLLQGAFVDLNCSCGVWDDGTSPVMITHQGEVIAHETMPTVELATMLADATLPNPYFEAFPQQDKYAQDQHAPINTYVYLTVDGTIRHGLQLDSIPVKGCPYFCDEAGGQTGRKLRFGHYNVDDTCAFC